MPGNFSFIAGQKVMVAGGAGFLGSHLVDKLLQADCQVTALDNLQTGSLSNLSHLNSHPNFIFSTHDIIEPFDSQFDLIFNLACPASPPHYQSDPIRTMKTSVIGTLNLLELAKRNHATMVHASTSEIYGDPLQHPQKEDYWGNVNPLGPRACYDEGKRAAETLCSDFRRMGQTDVKVARIFNTYGPRMDAKDGRVVSNFIVQCLQNAPLTVYGDGKQTRSFCYVDDLIEGLVLLAQTPLSEGGPINLGNPNEFNILELVEVVRRLTGSSSEAVFEALPQDDPRQRRPDIAKAKQVLGWTPQTTIEDGIAKTIRYFRQVLSQGEP